MAIDYFFTGFEGGQDTIFQDNWKSVVVDDASARTGQFHLQCNVPVADTEAGYGIFRDPTVGIALTNDSCTGKCRVFFKLIALPSGDGVVIAGYGFWAALYGNLRVRANGKFAASVVTSIGTYSTAALVVDTWYRADITVLAVDAAAQTDITTTASVYTESGTLIETVTKTLTNAVATGTNFGCPQVGHIDTINSTFLCKFDDFISIIDEDSASSLPTATRITRVDSTSIAQNTVGLTSGTNWSGNYQSITEIPLGTTNVMTSEDLDTQLMFGHASAAALGVSGCQAIRLVFQLKSFTAGNEWIVINGNSTSFGVLTTYPTIPDEIYQFTTMTDTDFDNFIFGVRNQRTQLDTLAQMYCEVLHEGTNYWPDELLANDPGFKCKVINWTGNGAVRTITGVGFKSQVVLYGAAGTNGMAIKIGNMGGTKSLFNNGAFYGDAMMLMTDDGFVLGPSVVANQNLVKYFALCFQDGGFGEDCFSIKQFTFLGTGIDNVDLVVAASFQPEIVLLMSNGAINVYRTNLEAGDSSIPLNNSATVTNWIQALNSDGFEIGTTVNVIQTLIYGLAIKNLSFLSAILKIATFVASGSTTSITGLAFTPEVVIAKRISANAAQYREAVSHAVIGSSFWTGGGSDVNGITSIVANGFNLGSTLSQSAQTTKYLAAKTGEISIAGAAPVVNAGVNQSIVFGSVAPLVGSVTDSVYPCAVITSLWTKVSGPGTVTFVNSAAPTTNASFSASGVYVLRLTGNNGLNSASDDIQITVVPQVIVVNAGIDQQVIISNPVVQLEGLVNKGMLLFTGFGDSPAKALSPTGVISPVILPQFGEGGCEGIIQMPSGNFVLTALLNSTSPFLCAAAYDEFLAVIGGDIVSTEGISKAGNNFYALRRPGTSKIFKYDDSATKLTEFSLGVSLSGDHPIGITPNGLFAYYGDSNTVKRRDLTLNSTVTLITGPTGFGFLTPLSILVLNNGDILVGWYKVSTDGYIGHYDSSGNLKYNYALSGSISSPNVLTPALDQNSFWVSYYIDVGTDTTSVSQIELVTGEVLNTFDPPDDGFEYDSPFCLYTVEPTGLTYLWTKVSGPGTVLFSDDTILDPEATFSAPGVYVLRLTATNGDISPSDDVQIMVIDECTLPIDPPFDDEGN